MAARVVIAGLRGEADSDPSADREHAQRAEPDRRDPAQRERLGTRRRDLRRLAFERWHDDRHHGAVAAHDDRALPRHEAGRRDLEAVVLRVDGDRMIEIRLRHGEAVALEREVSCLRGSETEDELGCAGLDGGEALLREGCALLIPDGRGERLGLGVRVHRAPEFSELLVAVADVREGADGR